MRSLLSYLRNFLFISLLLLSCKKSENPTGQASKSTEIPDKIITLQQEFNHKYRSEIAFSRKDLALHWLPVWPLASEKTSNGKTMIYVPVQPVAMEKGNIVPKIVVHNLTKYLIIEQTASNTVFYEATYVADHPLAKAEAFNGFAVMRNLGTHARQSYEFNNGTLRNKPVRDLSNALWVCSYVTVANFFGQCPNGYFQVMATQGMPSAQPGVYAAPAPYDPMCQTSWLQTDSYTKTYCSESSSPNGPLPPPPTPGGVMPAPQTGGITMTIDPSSVSYIPCPSSFNFIRAGNWQHAVITDYRFSYAYSRTGREYPIDIGKIEVGLPFITYNGYLIQADVAQRITAQAARFAEQIVANFLNAYLDLRPPLMPEQMDFTQFKHMFKDEFRVQIDQLLKWDYYNGQDIQVSRVLTDEGYFSLKDKTQYRTLKFWGRDCL